MSYKQDQAYAAKAKAEAEAKAAVDLEIANAAPEEVAAAKALADADAEVAAKAKADADTDTDAANAKLLEPAKDDSEAFYKVITGYPIYHPYQEKLVKTEGATSLKHDGWVQAQLDAGILIVVAAPEPQVVVAVVAE